MIAQSLGEYGGLTRGSADALLEFLQVVEDHVRNPNATTWLVVAVSTFAVWFFLLRRR